MANLPILTREEMLPLTSIRNENFIEFHRNVTSYFLKDMNSYIKGKKVFRCSIMGETRGGKSEIGSTLAFWYCKIFNHYLDLGVFDDIDVFSEGRFEKQKLNFSTRQVCENQMVYMQNLREEYKKKILPYGQIWQIDEDKGSTGGAGSMSEMIEMTNMNNIIAKFCQSEIWIQPLKFESRNTVFGLKIIKKDEINRVNWCLLYKPIREPSGAVIYKFMGWVKIPLHENEKFRKEYNSMKNDWIGSEIEGKANPRLIQRSKTAEMLVKEHPKIFEKNEKTGRFLISKSKMIVYLKRLIMKGEVHPFNELEQDYIIDEAQMIMDEYVE